jgi:hypothetical protein
VAEELAFKEEQQRLVKLRRSDLARRVELVSDRPGLGYDIRSFERDAAPRHIEVKHIGLRRTFFLSEHEWRQSRILLNYWFYFVSNADGIHPCVEMLRAEQLKPDHLVPTQYLVRLTGR